MPARRRLVAWANGIAPSGRAALVDHVDSRIRAADRARTGGNGLSFAARHAPGSGLIRRSRGTQPFREGQSLGRSRLRSLRHRCGLGWRARRRDSRRSAARAWPSPKSDTSAGPASTSAACPRSSSSTPRIFATRCTTRARATAGRSASASFDWPTLRDNKTREIERLNGIYEGLLRDAGVEHVEGRARIVDAAYRRGRRPALHGTENILVATGGWPTVPEIPGAEHGRSPRTRSFPRTRCRARRSSSAAATSPSSSRASSTASAST